MVISTDYIRELLEEIEPPKIKEAGYKSDGMMLEFPIMDLHLGKLAEAEETGDEYNIEIAKELVKTTVLDILGKVEKLGLPIEQTVFQIGQDYFHVDNSKHTTTNGTIMSQDISWHKMFGEGVELMVWIIEQIRRISPVKIYWVGGNHDWVLSYCLAHVINAYYREVDGVEIELSASPRKYIHYGNNLIGYSHGDEDRKRIKMLMAQEVPELWGQTKYHEWHLGHYHHYSEDDTGITVLYLPALTASDEWHAKKGFTGERGIQVFLWDKIKGKQFVIHSNIKE
jgi:hypothetical protein